MMIPEQQVRAAYADPPYIGQARKHYADDPRCAEVDHAELIQRLEGYDGWALSCSSPSLQRILALCPPDVRIGAWVKPFCAFKANVNPAYAWEPVIFKPARRRTREQMTVRDWVSEVITLKKGVVGAKPPNVAFWLFEILGLNASDELDDLFPGSGAISRAWTDWRGSMFANSVPDALRRSDARGVSSEKSASVSAGVEEQQGLQQQGSEFRETGSREN